MKRRLFNLLAALSLLLCLATATLWIRSYYIMDSIGWYHTDGKPAGFLDDCIVACSCGGMRVTRDHEAYTSTGEYASGPVKGNSFFHQASQDSGYPYVEYNFWPSPFTEFRAKGFQFVYIQEKNDRIQSVTFPIAIIFFSTLFLPAMWIRRMATQRRRSKRNLCPTCGYDLRATPTRCPEYGTVPSHTTNHTH